MRGQQQSSVQAMAQQPTNNYNFNSTTTVYSSNTAPGGTTNFMQSSVAAAPPSYYPQGLQQQQRPTQPQQQTGPAFVQQQQQRQQQQPIILRPTANVPHYNNRPVYQLPVQPAVNMNNIRSLALQTPTANGVVTQNIQLQQPTNRFPPPQPPQQQQQGGQIRHPVGGNPPPRPQNAVNPNIARPQQQQQISSGGLIRPPVNSTAIRSSAPSIAPSSSSSIIIRTPNNMLSRTASGAPGQRGLAPVPMNVGPRPSPVRLATAPTTSAPIQQRIVVTSSIAPSTTTTITNSHKRHSESGGGGSQQSVPAAKVPRVDNGQTAAMLKTAAAEVAAKIGDKDCEVLVVQMKNSGMPIIQSVQGNVTTAANSRTTSTPPTAAVAGTSKGSTDSVTTLHNNPNITITPVKPTGSSNSNSRTETVDLTNDKRPPAPPVKQVLGNPLACQVCNHV